MSYIIVPVQKKYFTLISPVQKKLVLHYQLSAADDIRTELDSRFFACPIK